MADEAAGGGNGTGGGSGSGAGGSGGSSSGGGDPPRSSGGKRDESFVDRFIRYRHRGNARAAVQELLRDNRGYRESFRDLKRRGRISVTDDRIRGIVEDLESENQGLREQIEGGIVLKGDDKTKWEAFKALNLPPDEVKKAIARRDELETKDARTERRKTINKAADKLEWDAEVLADLLESKGLVLVRKEIEKQGGGTKKVWAIKKADEKDDSKAVSAQKYIEENHRTWLRALETDPADEEEGALEDESGDERDTDEDDDSDDDDSGDDEYERPSRRRKTARAESENGDRDRDRGRERRGVRVPAQRGGKGPRARGMNSGSEVVKKTLGNTYEAPSKRREQSSRADS